MKKLLLIIIFIVGGILFSTPTAAADCAPGLTCTSRASCLPNESSCTDPATGNTVCCIRPTPTPTPKIEPLQVTGDACPPDGTTIYPPNSECYAQVNKVETLGANLVDSNEGFLTYPLTCISAPTVTYKETFTTSAPLPTPTTIYKDVSVGTDVSNAQLGFLGPDSTTLATSNPDTLAKKYLFNALFDRPGADPNAQRESFRTFWRMLDNLSQAQLKAYYIQNFEKHVYYYVDKDYKQQPIKVSDLKTKLPDCLKNFGIVADILGCWKNDKYLDQYIQLGIEDPEAREAYDALLPFDFNNSRSYLSNEQPFSGISEENIPYLQAILSGLKGYQNSIPGLFDYYTPESARKNLALYPILPSYELLSLQYPIIKIVSAINKNNCSVPAKSSSLSSPKTYPTNPITTQTIGVPVTPVLIDSKPDECICDPESGYCTVSGRRVPTLCSIYSNNESLCLKKHDQIGNPGCMFFKGEYTYELTGSATGFSTTVFNNPKITSLTDLIVGGKPLLSNTSDNGIINLINLISDKLISPVQPSFYKMLLPDFASESASPKTFVSAPAVNTTASTANADATVTVSGGNTIYRENNLAQDTMHLLQNCWLVPSDQQSSSKCGSKAITCEGQDTPDLTVSESACKLRNIDKINLYAEVKLPQDSLPPTMVAIIEKAADAYKVPASSILSVLGHEQGFNRSEIVWTEENVKQWGVCGGKMPFCDDKIGGTAQAPYGFFATWFYKDAGSGTLWNAVQIIDPSKTKENISLCNFMDVTFAVAKALSITSSYRPLKDASMQTCFGLSMTNTRRPTSCSRSEWTNAVILQSHISYAGYCPETNREYPYIIAPIFDKLVFKFTDNM